MGIRILVIEDEPAIADFIVRGLREEGFTVERAGDGADGWHALRTASWDLVLLDWWLPEEDGISLLRRFRESGRIGRPVRGGCRPRHRGRRLAARLRAVLSFGSGASPGESAESVSAWPSRGALPKY
jgi:CheY-like chemotaxis protein